MLEYSLELDKKNVLRMQLDEVTGALWIPLPNLNRSCNIRVRQSDQSEPFFSHTSFFASDYCIKWPHQEWCYFLVFCLQSHFSNWKDDFLFCDSIWFNLEFCLDLGLSRHCHEDNRILETMIVAIIKKLAKVAILKAKFKEINYIIWKIKRTIIHFRIVMLEIPIICALKTFV